MYKGYLKGNGKHAEAMKIIKFVDSYKVKVTHWMPLPELLKEDCNGGQ